jgi:hypothetical protein
MNAVTVSLTPQECRLLIIAFGEAAWWEKTHENETHILYGWERLGNKIADAIHTQGLCGDHGHADQ